MPTGQSRSSGVDWWALGGCPMYPGDGPACELLEQTSACEDEEGCTSRLWAGDLPGTRAEARVRYADLDALMAGNAIGCHRWVRERLRGLTADAARVSEPVLDLIRREEDRLADEEVRHG